MNRTPKALNTKFMTPSK